MSWIELDDRILEHPKFIRAVHIGGSASIHLWLGVRAFCSQLLTDGHMPDHMMHEVKGPKGRRTRVKSMQALIDSGLIEKTETGYYMHDYLDWSSSRNDILSRREAARQRKQKSRSKPGPVTPGSQCDGPVTPGDGHEGVTRDSRARVSSSSSLKKKEDFSSPPNGVTRDVTPDLGKRRFEASFQGLRGDVRELHEAYKRTFGLDGHRLTGAQDVNAMHLADAIDAHGLNACLAVLKVAPQDGMVSGEDDKGRKHQKIAYIFGNQDTLARLLKSASDREREQNADPMALYERARRA